MVLKLSLWTEGCKQQCSAVWEEYQASAAGCRQRACAGKGLCIREHKDVCCVAGKLFLTGKMVNITEKTAVFHILCTVKPLCKSSGLPARSSIKSAV